MTFSARRIGAFTAILLAVAAFFALLASAGHNAYRADGAAVASQPSVTPSAHTDGAIWG
jgi:hypothetical protein